MSWDQSSVLAFLCYHMNQQKMVGSTFLNQQFLQIVLYLVVHHMYMSESEILGTFQNARIKCYFSPLFSTGYIKNGLRCL